ncbi:MAG: aminoacyl-tRNA hydrolase [Actinobacteria bacterium]|nr:aminoacyl-tRNA hydrolase [Actinomycetota bacterium]
MSRSALLLVGLRNPGSEYAGTRHNVGGDAVVAAAGRIGIPFKRAPRWIRAEIAEASLGAERAVLALPMTFMNESGGPVQALVKYFKPARLLVVHDDIDLPFGKLRLHEGRGTGGHNGVASIVRSLGDTGFWRLKIGVGRPPGRMDPAAFVLRGFTKQEQPDMDLVIVEAADVVRSFAQDGAETARQQAGEAYGRLFGK